MQLYIHRDLNTGRFGWKGKGGSEHHFGVYPSHGLIWMINVKAGEVKAGEVCLQTLGNGV